MHVVRGRLWAPFVFSVLCVAGDPGAHPLWAHPIPKDNHDRTIIVRLTRQAVRVDYRLELDEGRAARDLTREELAQITSPKEFYTVFTRSQSTILAGNLDARLDGKPVAFSCAEYAYKVPEMGHLVCDYRFEALWFPPADRPWSFTFTEGNYADDDFSRLQLTLQAGSGLSLSGVTAPDKALWDRPPVERKPGDNKRLRQVRAMVSSLGEESLAEYEPAVPPDPEPPRSGPKHRAVAAARSAPVEQAGSAKPATESSDATAEPAVEEEPSLLHLLLDTRKGFAVLLLLAAGLGAAHALTPGHGKTLVAAYLVGERGTVWHALLLGLVTTLTHTGAVLLLAGLGYFFPHAVAGTMLGIQLVGGLGIALLGFWLLLRRLSGQADHFHLPGQGHHHHHGHSHSHAPHLPALTKGTGVGWWHLLVLGMQGGMMPCGDAIVILWAAATTGRLALALPLLLAFSVGLAAVLVFLGIVVVSARRWVGSRWGNHPGLHRLIQALPIVSAALILGMGLWLCYASVHPGSALPGPGPR